jgi:uncharacterized repeat protein (TIGR04138 family)
MNDEKEYLQSLAALAGRDQRYDIEAYLFVQRALAALLDKIGRRRHVSGAELLEGVRELALREYGPLSRDVLAHWGVTACADFGEIVFGMVEAGLLSKTDQDSREDFRGGYDFREAFESPFLPAPPARKP